MEDLRATFDYAITKANTNLGIPLVGKSEEINFGDSIQGYSRLCKLMQVGIELNVKCKYTRSHNSHIIIKS